MIDKFRVQDTLSYYKKDFVQKQWPNEKYKWEAVKHFQDNWDINASDFDEMLTRSLEKTYKLRSSMNLFPAGMIEGFAKKLQRKYGRCLLHSLMRHRMLFKES